MGLTKLSLKGRALRLLAQREHTYAELVRKLTPHVQEGDDLGALLDTLQAQGWIDENRVVASHLHQRSARLGTQRLVQELRRKGVSEEAVRAQTASLRASEFERAQAVWARRFGQKPHTPQEQARQMRFLAARGFEAPVVRRVLEAAQDE